MLLPLLTLATQAATVSADSLGVGEIANGLTTIGVAGLIGFAFKFNSRMTRIETVLLEPETGVKSRVQGIGKQGHQHASTLQGHQLTIEEHTRRLNDHDEDLVRLDHDKENRRPLGPADIGSLDRRGVQ